MPTTRILSLSDRPPRQSGRFVLYWMIGARRANGNFALDHAVQLAEALDKPLFVFEPLRIDYPWASERFHRFIIEGMRDNAAMFARAGIRYFPFVEQAPGEARGVFAALARSACVIVTDLVPGTFLPRWVRAAAARTDVALVAVDGSGLVPLATTDRAFPSAHTFRRHVQRELPAHLAQCPAATLAPGRRPLAAVPNEAAGWSASDVSDPARLVASLTIAKDVGSAPIAGGSVAATARLADFVARKLARFHEDRSDPDADGASGLSPYLHFGHIGVHEIFAAVMRAERWSPSQASLVARGSKQGFWGMSPGAESFLDELITWRELALHGANTRPDFDRLTSIPQWARNTLDRHARDPRARIYTLDELRHARTHDSLWNAAQRQLVTEGAMQNYLRMLWGKKVIEWSESPQQAFERLVELNNRYALDGRDANSMAGILWCFGLYDRPWGPERPVFGLVRYMSSDNTRRKLAVKKYLARYGANDETGTNVAGAGIEPATLTV